MFSTLDLHKVHIFLEGHKILRNLHRRLRFDRYYLGQIYGADFAKLCGLLEYINFTVLVSG